jgi:hypothetical protein
MVQAQYTKRLAQIRAQWEIWSAQMDTSQWEATFFFNLLDQKERELLELRKLLSKRREE